jgi:molybdate transport system ATP-binding protein
LERLAQNYERLNDALLVAIHQATVRKMDKVVFESLDFEWRQGQHWALVGQTGLQMTVFLETILGRAMVTSGEIRRPFAADYSLAMEAAGKVHSFRDLIAIVSQQYQFRNKSNLQNFYYQQRFNSMDSEDALTVREYLRQSETAVPGFWDLQRVLELMRLEHLADKSLLKLSNGETRRLAIALALLKNPRLLLLDQPLTGLDVDSRKDFPRILEKIIASGIHVMMSTHSDEIPEGITQVAVLRSRSIKKSLKAADYVPERESPNRADNIFAERVGKLLSPGASNSPEEEIIRLKNVNVSYAGQKILDGVSWTVRSGEHWLLRGANGAGKSTLLSLILGENPQAYANDIWLFGRKRGTGESIWDIKKQLGFVAPELARFFPSNQTVQKVLLSGFFDTMGLFRKPSPEQERHVREWLEFLGLADRAGRLFTQLSLEQQRFVLLARAVIKQPKLLVLDEAAQGMDELQRAVFRQMVDAICAHLPLALVYVSHYDEDVPDCVHRVLVLESGRVKGRFLRGSRASR